MEADQSPSASQLALGTGGCGSGVSVVVCCGFEGNLRTAGRNDCLSPACNSVVSSSGSRSMSLTQELSIYNGQPTAETLSKQQQQQQAQTNSSSQTDSNTLTVNATTMVVQPYAHPEMPGMEVAVPLVAQQLPPSTVSKCPQHTVDTSTSTKTKSNSKKSAGGDERSPRRKLCTNGPQEASGSRNYNPNSSEDDDDDDNEGEGNNKSDQDEGESDNYEEDDELLASRFVASRFKANSISSCASASQQALRCLTNMMTAVGGGAGGQQSTGLVPTTSGGNVSASCLNANNSHQQQQQLWSHCLLCEINRTSLNAAVNAGRGAVGDEGVTLMNPIESSNIKEQDNQTKIETTTDSLDENKLPLQHLEQQQLDDGQNIGGGGSQFVAAPGKRQFSRRLSNEQQQHQQIGCLQKNNASAVTSDHQQVNAVGYSYSLPATTGGAVTPAQMDYLKPGDWSGPSSGDTEPLRRHSWICR